MEKLNYGLLISPEEAVTLSRERTISDIRIAEAIEKIHIAEYSNDDDVRWVYLTLLSTIWNAGRVQGIREERQKRKGAKI